MQPLSKNFFLGAVIAILLITTIIFGVLWIGAKREVRSKNEEVKDLQKQAEALEEKLKGRAEKQTKEDTFFEVLYAYHPRSLQGVKIFRADITGERKSEIDRAYTPSTKIQTTRDGKYLAKWDGKNLSTASSKDLVFKIVFKTDKQDEEIKSVIWFPDGSTLGFVVSKLGEYEDKGFNFPLEPNTTTVTRPFEEHRLYIINKDGVAQHLLGVYNEPRYGIPLLQGVNTQKHELYWLEGDRNFTVVSLDDGRIKEVKKEIQGFGNVFLRENGEKVYYGEVDYKQGIQKIVEYTLETDEKRVIFEGRKGNYLASDRLMFSNDTILIVAEYDGSKSILYEITLPVAEVTPLLDDSAYYHYFPKSLSPDGKYLWLEALKSKYPDQPNYYGNKDFIMNLKTKEITPFPKEPLTNQERVEFLGWIRTTGEEEKETLDTSTWKTYRNEQYGFEVKYPRDFVVYSGFENEGPVLKDEDNILVGENNPISFMHPSGVSIRIVKEKIMKISDFEEWFWKNVKNIYLVADIEPYHSEDIELIKKSLRYTNFIDLPAIGIEIPEQKGLGWPYKVLLVENNDVGFIIRLIGRDQVNLKILSTFKFIS